MRLLRQWALAPNCTSTRTRTPRAKSSITQGGIFCDTKGLETTPNARVVPGVRRISRRMWEEGWGWRGMVRRDGEGKVVERMD